MRQTSVEEQIRNIQKATEIAAKSKASALKFLRDAGIIPSEDKTCPQVDKEKATIILIQDHEANHNRRAIEGD
jgi:hypothetical protein